MELWMSGEIQADVAEAYRSVRKLIESEINQELKLVSPVGRFHTWAFIAIIRSEEHPDYSEVSKKDVRRRLLEFRLRINHNTFRNATAVGQRRLVYHALGRCIPMMAQLGMSADETKVLELLISQKVANC
jgi:stress-induced morphogen